jgi:hypothetical protein
MGRGHRVALVGHQLVRQRHHVERAYVQGTLDVPKSGSSRTVDISPQLKATLRALYAERFGKVVWHLLR